MKEIWFKRKTYGFGWVPITWQGWLVLALYLLIVFGNIARVDSTSHSVSDTLLNILPVEIVATAILIAICYAMGETPRWQWGVKKSKESVKKQVISSKKKMQKKRTKKSRPTSTRR